MYDINMSIIYTESSNCEVIYNLLKDIKNRSNCRLIIDYKNIQEEYDEWLEEARSFNEEDFIDFNEPHNITIINHTNNQRNGNTLHKVQ